MITDFIEYFTQAQHEALSERESEIMELRYGFMGEEAHTLQEIGDVIGVSRERIRQIITKSYLKIKRKGRMEIKKGEHYKPCAELLRYIDSNIKPNEHNMVDSIVKFVEAELKFLPIKTHAIPLILSLLSIKEKHSIVEEVYRVFNQHELDEIIEYKNKQKCQKLNNLLSYTIWPSTIKFITDTDIKKLKRMRDVGKHINVEFGEYFSKKLNRFVQYESGLEKEFYQLLDQCDEIRIFQEQPIDILYDKDGYAKKYFPDVLIVLKDLKVIIVEIKPLFKMALSNNLLKFTALKKYCYENGYGLLITDGKKEIKEVQHYQIDNSYAKEILDTLKIKSLSWIEYKSIKEKYNINRNDFIALVLQNKLKWCLNPFSLSIK